MEVINSPQVTEENMGRNLLLLALAVSLSNAQPIFEVASIRPHPPNTPPTRAAADNRTVALSTTTLTRLVAYAYDLRDHQVAGGTGWMTSSFFDVVAKLDDATPPTPANLRAALQALLTERFQLKFHTEQRELNVYHLVTQGTPKMKVTTEPSSGGLIDPGHVASRSTTMADFARLLAVYPETSRPVIDQTGLSGNFELDLHWAPLPRNNSQQPAAEPSGPSLFTALQEQLGLRLQASKDTIPVWVIDSASPPSEN